MPENDLNNQTVFSNTQYKIAKEYYEGMDSRDVYRMVVDRDNLKKLEDISSVEFTKVSLKEGRKPYHIINAITPLKDVDNIPDYIEAMMKGYDTDNLERVSVVIGVNAKIEEGDHQKARDDIENALANKELRAKLNSFDFPVAIVGSTYSPTEEIPFPYGDMRNEVLHSEATQKLTKYACLSGHPYITNQDTDKGSRRVGTDEGKHLFDAIDEILETGTMQVPLPLKEEEALQREEETRSAYMYADHEKKPIFRDGTRIPAGLILMDANGKDGTIENGLDGFQARWQNSREARGMDASDEAFEKSLRKRIISVEGKEKDDKEINELPGDELLSRFQACADIAILKHDLLYDLLYEDASINEPIRPLQLGGGYRGGPNGFDKDDFKAKWQKVREARGKDTSDDALERSLREGIISLEGKKSNDEEIDKLTEEVNNLTPDELTSRFQVCADRAIKNDMQVRNKLADFDLKLPYLPEPNDTVDAHAVLVSLSGPYPIKFGVGSGEHYKLSESIAKFHANELLSVYIKEGVLEGGASVSRELSRIKELAVAINQAKAEKDNNKAKTLEATRSELENKINSGATDFLQANPDLIRNKAYYFDYSNLVIETETTRLVVALLEDGKLSQAHSLENPSEQKYFASQAARSGTRMLPYGKHIVERVNAINQKPESYEIDAKKIKDNLSKICLDPRLAPNYKTDDDEKRPLNEEEKEEIIAECVKKIAAADKVDPFQNIDLKHLYLTYELMNPNTTVALKIKEGNKEVIKKMKVKEAIGFGRKHGMADVERIHNRLSTAIKVDSAFKTNISFGLQKSQLTTAAFTLAALHMTDAKEHLPSPMPQNGIDCEVRDGTIAIKLPTSSENKRDRDRRRGSDSSDNSDMSMGSNAHEDKRLRDTEMASRSPSPRDAEMASRSTSPILSDAEMGDRGRSRSTSSQSSNRSRSSSRH